MYAHSLLVLATTLLVRVSAIDLDVTSTDSIKSAASNIANGLVQYYNGNETGEIPGILPSPYYFWEAGAMWDTLIQYWNVTGDSQYNAIVTQALVFQQGQRGDYMPANQSNSEGQDDQSTWGLAALSAAESGLPESDNNSWLKLAQGVFNTQAARWDKTSCNGGLRWQIYPFNSGYDYKNTASNGQFFELASRLARYTGNATFSQWATTAYEWGTTSGFVDADWNVYDGALVGQNCTRINKSQFSYNAGTFIAGVANMYNITSGDEQVKWKAALDGLLSRTVKVFFPNQIATEVSCESSDKCTIDMKAFKGILGQRLVDAMLVAPYTAATIKPLLEANAKAAAKACGTSGCSFFWDGTTTGSKPGTSGVSEQLSALSYVQSLLAKQNSAGTSSAANATTTSGSSAASPTSSASGSSTSKPNSGTTVTPEKALVGLLGALWMSVSWFML